MIHMQEESLHSTIAGSRSSIIDILLVYVTTNVIELIDVIDIFYEWEYDCPFILVLE